MIDRNKLSGLERELMARELYFLLQWPIDQIVEFGVCTEQELYKWIYISDEMQELIKKGKIWDEKFRESCRNARR